MCECVIFFLNFSHLRFVHWKFYTCKNDIGHFGKHRLFDWFDKWFVSMWKTKNTLLSLKWCFWFWLCSINCSLEIIWRVNLISIDRITYSIEATERNGEREREIEEEKKEKVTKLIIDCCVFIVRKIELQVQERSLEHNWLRIKLPYAFANVWRYIGSVFCHNTIENMAVLQ